MYDSATHGKDRGGRGLTFGWEFHPNKKILDDS
jgi:hypothetical protein